jgi:hypothetical protein
MKAINESKLKLRLSDSGSTKRLNSYRKGVTFQDEVKRVYDPKAIAVLLKYAKDPCKIIAELEYLRNLTNENGEKFCRSIGKYSDMEVQFSYFQRPEKASFRWNRFFKRGVAKVCARYAKAKLSMLTFNSDEDVYNAVTDWSTATGFTALETGKRKKVDVLSDICSVLLDKEGEAKQNGTFDAPVVCARRTQGSGAYDDEGKRTYTWKPKKRAVFPVDVYQICSESRFGYPLNQFLISYEYSNIGKDDRWTTMWVTKHRNKGLSFISFDYSKYDSTIPSWLIHSAFDVIRCAFKTYDSELLSVIEEDFINKNIIIKDDVLYVTHGNPSGSRLTAIVNGICNEIITETWAAKFGVDVKYNIMGDDNLVFLYYADDAIVSQISQYITHNFGIIVNADKSNYGSWQDEPEYLSRYWSFDGPWRWFGEVISLIAYPETFRKYKSKKAVLTPEMIIYSYVLAYRKTMMQLIDVSRFLRDVNLSLTKLEWTKEQREAVPYNIRLVVELNGWYRKAPLAEALALARERQESATA